ncbi:MAG: helix-turn-helix domain-containing protein [Proteobacteria bacterium]|nr:helix-turn-helix domain-containing protein [Pseudomonadota bacterium]
MISVFSERLQLVIDRLKVDQKDLADSASISAQTITGYLRNGRLPNQKTLAAWVQGYGIDAHWLLTGEGEMFPKAASPAARVCNPVAVRIDELARLLGESGVGELEIMRSAKVMLEGEIAKWTKAQGGYSVREPAPCEAKAAEEPADYPATKQAAGDDTV